MSSGTPDRRTDVRVVAAVLTHLRPQLATRAVRRLVELDGFPPEDVLVVVNGQGGLLPDDPLARRVRLVRLPTNTGPAGGFAAALRHGAATGAEWLYLCEDDIALLPLPPGQVWRSVERAGAAAERVGAVAAYGRRFVPGRPGHTLAHEPAPGPALQPVDVAAWGATLVHRDVVDAGVLPDADWFFGYEDFDFFLRLQQAGFALAVDAEAARAVAAQTTAEGRASSQRGARPEDADEAWRAFYVARNFLLLARRHGDLGWVLWHAVFSVRRWQLARSRRERRALLAGWAAGLKGRTGQDPRYVREVGELGPPPQEVLDA